MLLLDEPTNGLDIPSKAQFRKLIASVMLEDKIILISTHQIRDLENLIDRVIIIDNGELLLRASVEDIANRLSFKTVSEAADNSKVLYAEETFKGVSIVQENVEGEDTKVNLEHLFNAVTENPKIIKAIFSNIETTVK